MGIIIKILGIIFLIYCSYKLIKAWNVVKHIPLKPIIKTPEEIANEEIERQKEIERIKAEKLILETQKKENLSQIQLKQLGNYIEQMKSSGASLESGTVINGISYKLKDLIKIKENHKEGMDLSYLKEK